MDNKTKERYALAMEYFIHYVADQISENLDDYFLDNDFRSEDEAEDNYCDELLQKTEDDTPISTYDFMELVLDEAGCYVMRTKNPYNKFSERPEKIAASKAFFDSLFKDAMKPFNISGENK